MALIVLEMDGENGVNTLMCLLTMALFCCLVLGQAPPQSFGSSVLDVDLTLSVSDVDLALSVFDVDLALSVSDVASGLSAVLIGMTAVLLGVSARCPCISD